MATTYLPTWALCIQIAYGVPTMISIVMLFWVFYISRHQQQLQSSFYKITKFLLVIDLLFYWFFNLENRAFLYGPLGRHLINFPADSFFYKIITFGFYFLNYLRSCIIIGESLNRFISVLYVDKRDTRPEKWLKRAIFPYILISIVVSLSQSWFYFWCTFRMARFGDDIDSYGLSPSLTFMKTNGSLRSACAGFIVGIVCFVLNGWSVAILIYKKKQLKTKRVGINLFVISIIDFVLHTFHGITEICFYISLYVVTPINFELIQAMFLIRLWIIDLDCLHRPWILFYMSEHIYNVAKSCIKRMPITTFVLSSVNHSHVQPEHLSHFSAQHRFVKTSQGQNVVTVT